MIIALLLLLTLANARWQYEAEESVALLKVLEALVSEMEVGCPDKDNWGEESCNADTDCSSRLYSKMCAKTCCERTCGDYTACDSCVTHMEDVNGIPKRTCDYKDGQCMDIENPATASWRTLTVSSASNCPASAHAAPKKEGEVCYNNECDAGLECLVTQGDAGTCVRIAPKYQEEGEDCNEKLKCGEGLFCDGVSCEPIPEKCEDEHDFCDEKNCKKAGYEEYMRGSCVKTCGYCGSTGTCEDAIAEDVVELFNQGMTGVHDCESAKRHLNLYSLTCDWEMENGNAFLFYNEDVEIPKTLSDICCATCSSSEELCTFDKDSYQSTGECKTGETKFMFECKVQCSKNSKCVDPIADFGLESEQVSTAKCAKPTAPKKKRKKGKRGNKKRNRKKKAKAEDELALYLLQKVLSA